MLIRHCDICGATPATEYTIATGKTTEDPVEVRTYHCTAVVDLCPVCAAEALKYVLQRNKHDTWLKTQAQCYEWLKQRMRQS